MRFNNFTCNKFLKIKTHFVIFAKQHQESKEKLEMQWKSTSTKHYCYTLQNEIFFEPLHNNPKMDKIAQKHNTFVRA